MMHQQQVLISPLHLPVVSQEYLNKLRQKRVIALAMEYIKDDAGAFPLVRAMSEVAGVSAILIGAELLSSSRGYGILLGGISGVPPAKVVILGGGVVAEYAARAAMGLGAEVRIFDNNIYKLSRLKRLLGNSLYTSSINTPVLLEELLHCDIAIGAIHSKTGRTPMVCTEEMVARMKSGAVIIDVSIDQGGCFETSEITTHANPTIVKHDVIHYCVPNISSRYAKTASMAVSNILTPIFLKAESEGGIESLFDEHSGLRHGIYTYKGCLTNHYLGERFGIKSTDLELLIASRL
jgi:alanine dehydrogenase